MYARYLEVDEGHDEALLAMARRVTNNSSMTLAEAEAWHDAERLEGRDFDAVEDLLADLIERHRDRASGWSHYRAFEALDFAGS